MRTICNLVFALLLPAICMAQHKQVHDAMEDKYGEPGKDKANDFFSKMNGKMDAEYTFTLSMVMHVTTYKKGEKKDETDLKYFFNTGKKYFAFSPEQKKKNDETFMIYDNPNTSMIMLNKKDMTGMAININAFRSQASIDRQNTGTPAKTASSLECKKTGKTKTIEGYPCFEYVCIDNERNTRTEAWITEKIPFDISQSFARSPYAAMFRNTNGTGGMTMEVSYYKEDKLESTMQVMSINTAENLTVKTGDYKFASMQMH